MKINVINQTENRHWNYFRRYLKPVLAKTQQVLNLPVDVACSVILVDDEGIQIINRDYRQKDSVTDVISFAANEGDILETTDLSELGDIFINMEAMARQAQEYQHSLKREFCFLFAHGLLHCLGFDHQDQASEDLMLSTQKEILDGVAQRRKTTLKK